MTLYSLLLVAKHQADECQNFLKTILTAAKVTAEHPRKLTGSFLVKTAPKFDVNRSLFAKVALKED